MPVILKKGKETIFSRRHHWIFSGAIKQLPLKMENGSLQPVLSSDQKLLGYAYFNHKSALTGRIVSFGETLPEEAMLTHMKQALTHRQRFFSSDVTNAYRWINGEGDLLPGLVVDRYGDYLVIQIGTLGMEKLKPWIIRQLFSLAPIKGIYEKSLLPTRKEEGLSPFEGHLWGEKKEEVEILENGLSFIASIIKGQKTGFFLDQRQMRDQIRFLAKGRSILNCFSYSGGFTIAALKGGAIKVDSVDISEDAIALLKRNIQKNGFSEEGHEAYCEDVFHFLKNRPLLYDIVILDPPAFAKKKTDLPAAFKGYKTINREAIKNMPPSSLLLTCSCSYHVAEPLFQQILFQAALEAKREVKIIGRHRLSPDHPINLCHPEGDYLKSLLLAIT